MKILKRDFDAAVKQPWNTETCLISQFNLRVLGYTGEETRMDVIHSSEKAERAMEAFDQCFIKPGDEKKPQLQKLRASLPIQL